MRIIIFFYMCVSWCISSFEFARSNRNKTLIHIRNENPPAILVANCTARRYLWKRVRNFRCWRMNYVGMWLVRTRITDLFKQRVAVISRSLCLDVILINTAEPSSQWFTSRIINAFPTHRRFLRKMAYL